MKNILDFDSSVILFQKKLKKGEAEEPLEAPGLRARLATRDVTTNKSIATPDIHKIH